MFSFRDLSTHEQAETKEILPEPKASLYVTEQKSHLLCTWLYLFNWSKRIQYIKLVNCLFINPQDLKDKAYVSDDQKVNDNISSDTAAQDKPNNEANQPTEVPCSVDVTALDASEIQDSETLKASQSPNVSGSSDVISGTPPKPSSRRQSFITIEKYEEGRPASVKKFTGPLSRMSCSQEPPKSQNDSKLPLSVCNSQPEFGKKVSKESVITHDSTNRADEQNMEIKAELKSVAKCPSEGDEDVIPDTQTQELSAAVEAGNKSSDTSCVEVNTEIAFPGGESEAFVASQDLSQVEPRRSGRRRSRPVLPGEESDQESKSKQQKKASLNVPTSSDSQKSTPAKKTDILPARTRRSRALEEHMSEIGKLQNSERKDEQKDSQVPSPTTSTSPLQGRKSKSKEVNQTEPYFDKSSLSQTDDKESLPNQSDSQSHGRPVRRTRVTNANVENSEKKQTVENSQGDSPAGVSKQVDSSASDTESQSPGRPRRARRSEASGTQSMNKPGLRNEQVSDPSHARALTPSKGKVGRPKRREEGISNISKNTRTGSVNSECSQGNEISELQDHSQGRGKYRTRRSSQALLTSVENSESDASDTRDGQRSKRAKGHKSSEVMPSTMMNEDAPGYISSKKDADISSVPMDVSKDEPEACLGVSTMNEDIPKTEDKEEAPAVEGHAVEHFTSDVKSADDEQQNDKDSKMQTDSDKEESVNTVLEERAVKKQNSLPLSAKVELNALELRTCPHTKKGRGRGRRRSTNCNCSQVSSTPSKEQSSSRTKQVVPDLKENKVLLESSSKPSETELNSITPVLPEEESVALQDNCPDSANVQSLSLPSLTEAEVPAEKQSGSQSSDVNKGTTQAVKHHKHDVDDPDDKHVEKEQDTISSETSLSRGQPQEGPSAPVASASHSQPVQSESVCQGQSESPASQEEIVHSGEKAEMPEMEELVPEIDGGVTALPEGTELDKTPLEVEDDGEATQIDKDLQPETALPCDSSVPPQTASAEACLDSPPKQKSSDPFCGNTEMRQSPSNSVTRGVWSPSASPSTSILKKGQKRLCEEDSPSPLVKVIF